MNDEFLGMVFIGTALLLIFLVGAAGYKVHEYVSDSNATEIVPGGGVPAPISGGGVPAPRPGGGVPPMVAGSGEPLIVVNGVAYPASAVLKRFTIVDGALIPLSTDTGPLDTNPLPPSRKGTDASGNDRD